MQFDPQLDPGKQNLRHLWAFCQVVAYRSTSRAADEINLSQPAISQGIRSLEAAFGVPMFNRTPGGMQPTGAGAILDARLRRGFAALSGAIPSDEAPTPTAARAQAADDADADRADAPSLLLRTSQLSALISLAETGSMATSAQQLGISEKSVARTLRNLELRLRRPLLLKDWGTVRLSAAGAALARAAKIFFREIELALEEIAADQGVSKGRLVIGGLPLARSFILPKAMVRFALRFPEMRVQLLEGSYESLMAGVRDGDIDILVGALRSEHDYPGIRQSRLFDEHLCVVARSDHPILDRPEGEAADIFAYPWIAPRPGSPARQQFDQMIGQARESPRILMEVASHIAVRSVLLESDCLALLSRHQIRYEVRQGQLSVVPAELENWPRQIGYAVRADWQPTPLQLSFLAELEQATTLSLAPDPPGESA